jgi:hypothetical protein
MIRVASERSEQPTRSTTTAPKMEVSRTSTGCPLRADDGGPISMQNACSGSDLARFAAVAVS